MQEVVRSLDQTSEHTPRTLAAALNRPLTIDDVAPWIRFDAKNYLRNLVERSGHWELRLLCWRPGQTSSLHGHGPAACAFRVIRGSATEAILGERDRVWAPGDVVEETRRGLVHQVGNAGADSLVTLHAYSPQLPVDSPSGREGTNVVIVGGGLSGVAVATHLLRRARPDLRITLVERGPWLGRGVAYGVDSTVFRLNVPAAKMSIDPDDPLDFVRWAGAEDTPSAFLPRSRYGAYVVERFAQALRASSGKLRVVRGDAARIERDAVVLADGTRLPAQRIVLATGLAPRISASGLPQDSRIVDAWDECALAALPREGRILILGSGLSALDVLAFLDAHRFRGQADIVSRRGLLPRPHAPHAGAPPGLENVDAAPRDLRGLLRWGRQYVRDLEARGMPWQLGVDSLRPHISTLWRKLPPQDRARFVRSIRPYWDVLRHRAPFESYETIEAWRGAGRLEVLAGSISACTPRAEDLLVQLRHPGGGRRERAYVSIVRCIGPALEGSEANAPLMQALVRDGLAVADPAGLGIVTDDAGRVMEAAGPSEQLFAIGALRRASSWETTAVPDISRHAHALARQLVD
jgi:uncharacterized NAD(P)/FAD-binding protein YdhS